VSRRIRRFDCRDGASITERDVIEARRELALSDGPIHRSGRIFWL
jgi:hypothetical protein